MYDHKSKIILNQERVQVDCIIMSYVIPRIACTLHHDRSQQISCFLIGDELEKRNGKSGATGTCFRCVALQEVTRIDFDEDRQEKR